MRRVIACTLLWLVLAPALIRADAPPTVLHPGSHLLLDNRLVERADGLRRTVQRPRRTLPGPVVTGREDHNFQPYVTVLRPAPDGPFRMWYNVTAGKTRLGYLESPDGVHWQRPHRVLDDPIRIVFGASVLDEGPAFADPGRRYKLVAWNKGLWLAHSADGLGWAVDAPRPVLPGVNDIVSLSRDPIRNRYVALFGLPSQKEDGYRGKTANAREGYRRCVGVSTSPDAVHWEPPRRIFRPDERDEGITEFYSVGRVLARGDTLVGFLKVLRDDLPADPDGRVAGIGYSVLVWSHDGTIWHRDREPYFDRNPEPGSWDHAMAWIDCPLPVGDEVYLYYGGYARGHKVEPATERQVGLVKVPRDRYVAWETGPAGGTLRTTPVVLAGKTLSLNLDTHTGEARVQLVDEQGHPLPGRSFADCVPIKVDGLEAPVRWNGVPGELGRRPVRVEIRLRQARLFALNVAE